MAKSYRQHCSLAHALDLVGERWTLLIVRELLAGPRRYGDLASGLVSVPSNLLAGRLKQMEDQGLVRRRALDPPAHAVVVYELTELGAGLGDALAALSRWGMETMPAVRGDREFQSHWLVVALRARFDPTAAHGLTEAYEFRIDGDDAVHFAVTDGAGVAGVGPAPVEPAVIISADADTFLELSAGEITPPAAIGRGATFEGEDAAFERMGAVLPVRAPQRAEA
jgi:DNA-binding HxlR family transcriptional regulator